ncbi:MAG: ABC transporter substrate-binding protein, partial [Lachnospiraceae bacterium]|nr:ABC transporter substrate-binding protein [Lachnospiraceae bacterium]
MKKLLSLMLAFLMVISLAACAGKKDQPESESQPASEPGSEEITETETEPVSESDTEPSSLTVYMIAGPTGIGAANMMAKAEAGEYDIDYEFTIATAPDEVVGKIVKGEADIAAVPTNLASTLYAKTEGKVTILGVNTLGVLSFLEKEQTVNSVADLKGKTIYSTGQGANPQYILEYILKSNGIDPEKDVTINYKTENTELATVFAEDPTAVVMAPQPVATSIILNTGAVKVLDVNEEWEKVGGDSKLMMGCVIVRNEVLESDPDAVEQFMEDYEESIDAANEDPETTGRYCEEYGIVAKAALAQKAIPDCHIVWITGDEMKTGLSE